MGTSSSFGELQVKLARAAANVERSTPKTVRLAAEAAQEQINDAIKGRVPDFDMSGLSSGKTSKGKAKSGKVGTKIARTRGSKDATDISVRAVGPVHWLESGTRPHFVGVGRLSSSGEIRLTKRGRYRKGQQRRMNIPGIGWKTGPLAHMGTKAQHTWSKGVRKGMPKATQVFQRRQVADAFEPFT